MYIIIIKFHQIAREEVVIIYLGQVKLIEKEDSELIKLNAEHGLKYAVESLESALNDSIFSSCLESTQDILKESEKYLGKKLLCN